MNSLNVRNALFATAAGVICVPLVGLAAPCPPGEETEQIVVTTAAYLQDKDVYKVVDTTKNKANTVVLMSDKDGRVVEIRVQPIDSTKKAYVLTADTISIADFRGKAIGNLVLTAQGNVALAALAVKRTPSVQIGLVTEAVSKALAGHLKIQPTEALIVTGVLEGLPAAKAGLKEYDVITGVGGVKAVTHVKLKEILSKCKPGQVIVLRVLREGEPTEVKVRVEAIEPKVQLLTTTYETWLNKLTNLDAKLSFAQPRIDSFVTQVGRQQYLALTEPLRTQKFVTIDPKISTQVLKVNPHPLIKLYDQSGVSYSKLALADAYTRLTTTAEGGSLEARLLTEITTLQQQLTKLKALISELEATSNNEDE